MLKNLNPQEYHVLNDLLIPDGASGQTQVDHVVVSVHGIFVLETKNWDCWIFGREDDREWTLSYPGGGKKKVQNPLRQNEGHVQAIMKLLAVGRERCHNLVFINPVSKFKTGPVPGAFQSRMLDHIRSYHDIVFDPGWVGEAVRKLREASMSHDKQAVAAHLNQVKSKRQPLSQMAKTSPALKRSN